MSADAETTSNNQNNNNMMKHQQDDGLSQEDQPNPKKVKMDGNNELNNGQDQQQRNNNSNLQNSNNQNNNNNNRNGNNNTNQNNNNNNSNGKSKRVYVANVPFDVKWSELKDLFREKVGNVTYCTIFENEDGKSRGCGLLEFQDPESARKAIETMHRSEFKNRELVVKEDLDCERDRFGRIITHMGGAGGGGRNRDDSQRRDGGNRDDRGDSRNRDGGRGDRGRQMQQQMQQNQQQMGGNSHDSYGYDHSVMSSAYGPSQHHNTFGLSQQFLDSLGISLPLNNRIFVANLEYKVDQNKLEEIFKLAGKVAKVKLSHDSQGQSRGYGTVEYEHPVEAVQAISMFHNQKLYGRTMSVRMDKYECEDDVEALPSKLPSGLDSIGKGLGVGGQPLNIAKSLMNAALVAPPPPPTHLAAAAGQQIPQMHQPQLQQPNAVMQQAVIAAQMQQLQQQHAQQQQQQSQHQQVAGIPQAMQQALPQTMQHQLQQSLAQQPAHLQQQYQIHQQLAQQQQPQQALGQPGAGIPPQMAGVAAYPTLQHLQAANAVRAAQPANVYQQQPQPQQPQQANQQQQAVQQATQPQQVPATSVAPATNLSVYSTFERQFREASAPSFTRN